MKTMHALTIAAAAMALSAPLLAADLGKKDSKYMTESAQGLMSEIKLGEMAQKQSQDQRVKDFGKRMVEDHGKDLQALKQLASQKNVSLPDGLNKDQSEEADKLAKLSGKDFDKEYLKYEAKDHKKDVKEHGEERDKTSDPDLRKFAASAYDTVSAHKKMVDGLLAQVR